MVRERLGDIPSVGSRVNVGVGIEVTQMQSRGVAQVTSPPAR